MKLLKDLEIYKKYISQIIINYFPKIIHAIVVLLIFYFLGRFIYYKLINIHYTKDGELDPHSKNKILVSILATILYYSSIIVGLFTGLVILGLNLNSILILFGSIGFAVALSLKDTLSNASSGIMILLLDYFDLGNLIEINNSGPMIVDKFNLFTTTIKQDGTAIIYPNTTITNGIIKNYNSIEDTRVRIEFVISNYDTDVPTDTLINSIKDAIINQSKYLTNKKKLVIIITSMDATTSSFMVKVPVKSINYIAARDEISLIVKKCISSNPKLFVTQQIIKIVA